MAARNADQNPNQQSDYYNRYGDGTSPYLYAISDQTIISLRPEWKPQENPTQTSDFFLEIPDAFMTDLHDYLTEHDEHEKDTYRG